MIALAIARAKRREGAIDRIVDFNASPAALITTDQAYDSTASSQCWSHKAWYDGGSGSQIWPLLERQKSQ